MCSQHVDILLWATAQCAFFLSLSMCKRASYAQKRQNWPERLSGACNRKGILNEVLHLHGESKRWTKNHVFVDMNYSLVTQKSGKRAVFKKDYLLRRFIKKNVLPSLECLKLFDSLKASRVQRRWLGGFLSLSHEPSRNYQRRRQRTSSQTCWRLLEPITAVFRWRWG